MWQLGRFSLRTNHFSDEDSEKVFSPLRRLAYMVEGDEFNLEQRYRRLIDVLSDAIHWARAYHGDKPGLVASVINFVSSFDPWIAEVVCEEVGVGYRMPRVPRADHILEDERLTQSMYMTVVDAISEGEPLSVAELVRQVIDIIPDGRLDERRLRHMIEQRFDVRDGIVYLSEAEHICLMRDQAITYTSSIVREKLLVDTPITLSALVGCVLAEARFDVLSEDEVAQLIRGHFIVDSDGEEYVFLPEAEMVPLLAQLMEEQGIVGDDIS